jgi:hypothetical protein
MVYDVIDKLQKANKVWGQNVYERNPIPNVAYPCLSVYAVNETEIVTDGNGGMGIFDHYITVDLWTHKETSITDVRQWKKDVINAVKTVNSLIVLDAVRDIPDDNLIHLVFDFYMIGGKQDDFR